MEQIGGASVDTPYTSYIHEFVYVDVNRVRSYLAQLTEGLPERVAESQERSQANDTAAKLSGFGVERASGQVSRLEHTRTYGDLIVPLFEQHAESAGFLTDFTGELDDPAEWRSGRIHDLFEPGQIFRWTGDVRLFDAQHLADSVERFEEMSKNLLKLDLPGKKDKPAPSRRTASQSGSKPNDQLKQISKTTQPIREVLRNLLAGGIGLRMLPCGPETLDCGFGGLLLDRSEYIEQERAALFSRYGTEPAQWTVVASVARLSSRGPNQKPAITGDVLRQNGVIDRAGVEQMALQLLAMFEYLGMSEAPMWPSIAVTPLAVYRTMTPLTND